METRRDPRRRLLVIDDEVRLLRSIQLLLRDRHDVAVASRAEDALAQLEEGARFDLILCDLQMPGMNGIELAAQLAALDDEASERLVFLTGGAVTDEARAFLAATEHRVLTKPVPVDVLLAAVAASRPRSR